MGIRGLRLKYYYDEPYQFRLYTQRRYCYVMVAATKHGAVGLQPITVNDVPLKRLEIAGAVLLPYWIKHTKEANGDGLRIHRVDACVPHRMGE